MPELPSARILDIAEVLIAEGNVSIEFTSIRPGEKVHEILISADECGRTFENDGYYVICPVFQELSPVLDNQTVLAEEFSSERITLSRDGVVSLISSKLKPN